MDPLILANSIVAPGRFPGSRARRWHRILLWAINLCSAALVALALATNVSASPAIPQFQAPETGASGWTTPVKLSSEGVTADLPSIVADAQGGIHMFWVEQAANLPGSLIFYAYVQDGTLSRSNSVLYSPSQVILVTSLLGSDGRLHVVWVTLSSRVYYSSARVDEALSAPAWSSPRVIASPSYGAVLASVSGDLHLFYSNEGSPLVYQRISTDHGCTWSRPAIVGQGAGMNEGILSIRTALDEGGCLHLVWSQWDSSWWPGTRIYYTRSCDQGGTWTEPLEIDSIESGAYLDEYGPFWGNVVALGDGKIMLVWDGPPRGQRRIRLSYDGGLTWEPDYVLDETIRGIAGLNALATDSSGTLHLLTGGNTMQEGGAGVYYATWQDDAWSSLTMSDPLAGELPDVAVALGNELHAIWTTHQEVLYQMLALGAPRLPAGRSSSLERPCDAAVLAEPTAALPVNTPTAVPAATAVRVDASRAPDAQPTNGLIGLLPVVLLSGSVILVWSIRMRRGR